MASQSDVEDALTGLINSVLYPTGSPPSVLGHKVKIYAGWPDPASLDADLVETAGSPAAEHVSVYPLPTGRNTTRYPAERVENPITNPTYSIGSVGQVITITGPAPNPYAPQNAAVYLNAKPYVVQATAGQTAAQFAQLLLAAIQADIPSASIAGAAITVPAGVKVGDSRIGVVGSTTREVRREEKQFQISLWSSSPARRRALSDLIDPVLSDTPRLTLADGSVARLIFHTSREDDFVQKQRIYRRSLIYTVEFATTITEAAPQIIVEQIEVYAVDGMPLFTLDFSEPANAVGIPTI